MDVLQTEFEFTLPVGFVDKDGTMHREGRMRLATAADEIQPLKDPRVQQNPSYLTVILISRVVTQMGNIKNVNTQIIENLFSRDFTYLQDMYNRINQSGSNAIPATCPNCNHNFDVEVESLGE